MNVLLGYEGAVRDENLLESALAAPQNVAYYENASLIVQAATLIERLALNHPFIDGNKRTALIIGATFFLINDLHIAYKDEAEEIECAQEIELLVAKRDFQRFVRWLEGHVQPYIGGYVDAEE